jgi:type I restriction enzyme S subunit
MNEQHRIAAETLRQLSLLEEIQKQVATDLKLTDRLRQSVLKQAFRGKLTQQDSNDEPASVLLERIRTEKEIVVKAVVPRGRRRKEALNVS